MIENVHQHLINELQQSSKTDTIFIIVTVLFNLIVLAVNSGMATSAVSEKANPSDDTILIIFILANVVINGVALNALFTGKNTRKKLLNGLITMYQDMKVDKYYERRLLNNYSKRYWAFTVVIICLALLAVIVPLVIRLF